MTQTWSFETVNALYALPFLDLIYQAHIVHRQHFAANTVQFSTLLNIKTGRCPEDCAYCPQSAHYNTDLKYEKLMNVDFIVEKAKEAKHNGSTRFCMGAAWRSPPKKEFADVLKIIRAVKNLGLETCVTLGMLSREHTQQLKDAGLDFYNHNLDTSPEYYQEIISTRTYEDRLQTLSYVQEAGLKTCCGGIIGMGETREDRIGLLLQLVSLPSPPESVPINRLMPIKGTPLENADNIDNLEFIRTIAIARIMMPRSFVRLSAGRHTMSDEMHALCFMAGANSIFAGEKLLTTPNPLLDKDKVLFKKLGIAISQDNHAIDPN